MTRGKLHAGISKPLQRFSSCQDSHYSCFLHCSVRKQQSLADAISYDSLSEVGLINTMSKIFKNAQVSQTKSCCLSAKLTQESTVSYDFFLLVVRWQTKNSDALFIIPTGCLLSLETKSPLSILHCIIT